MPCPFLNKIMNTDLINAYCEKAIQNATRIKDLTAQIKSFVDVNFPHLNNNISLTGDMTKQAKIEVYIHLNDLFSVYIRTVKNNTLFNFMLNTNTWNELSQDYITTNRIYKNITKCLSFDIVKQLCIDFSHVNSYKECTLLMKQKVKEFELKKDFK